jgi:hypothetical protein
VADDPHESRVHEDRRLARAVQPRRFPRMVSWLR